MIRQILSQTIDVMKVGEIWVKDRNLFENDGTDFPEINWTTKFTSFSESNILNICVTKIIQISNDIPDSRNWNKFRIKFQTKILKFWLEKSFPNSIYLVFGLFQKFVCSIMESQYMHSTWFHVIKKHLLGIIFSKSHINTIILSMMTAVISSLH